MKNGMRNVSLLAGRFDARTVRLLWLLLSLILFILSAGAPAADPGHGL